MAPFVGAYAISAIMIGVLQREALTWGESVLLLCLNSGLAVVVWSVPWERVYPWVQVMPVLALIALIALGRDLAGGPIAGMSVLLLIPVIWIGIYGSVGQAALVVGACAAAIALPILLGFGYPVSEVGRAVSFLPVSALIVYVVRRGRRVALVDPLTGLVNRRAWDEALASQVEISARTGQVAAVVIIDIDLFKAFNDTYGHPEGDALLREAADAWSGQLRTSDTLARIGGEEFGVLLPATDARAALAVVDRLRRATPRGQTCSAGIALIEGVADTPMDVLTRADGALYAAKANGRNRVVVATD